MTPGETTASSEELDETWLRQLVAHLPFFAVLIDRSRNFLWVNRLDPTLSSSDVLQHQIDEFISPEDLGRAIACIERAFETGEVGYYETEAYSEGAMGAWFGTRVVPLPRAPSGHQRALLLSTDVTERRNAEKALQRSEGRFRMLTEGSPDTIVMTNRERLLLYTNREPHLGRGRAKVLGSQRLEDVFHAEDRNSLLHALHQVFETGANASCEARSVDGTHHFRCRALALPDEEGEARCLVIGTDVTAELEGEQQRAELEAQLQHAQKMDSIGQLAGGVAHDFNNLLMVIQNRIHFARKTVEDGGDPRGELEEADRASYRAAQLVKQLLAFGRRNRINPKLMRASLLVKATMQLLKRVIPESIQFSYHEESDGWISADSTQLEQVLVNLCLNARDAIESKTGSISMRLSKVHDEDGSKIQISITDDGKGISDSSLTRIFEPFFTTKPPGQGSGLGLSMVHGIITQHKGGVDVVSSLGRGSTFTVSLPEAASQTQPRVTEAPVSSSPGRGSILVAEDDPAVRKLLVRILTSAGYQVLEAEDGQQALNILATQKDAIDLAILDAVMPKLNGQDVYLGMQELAPTVPTIFSSGYSSETLSQEVLEREGVTVLAKPYTPATLLQLVRQTLRG